ncbi:MAG: hypothetical protein ACFB2W_07070 [Leptolyngbyaceae cyanobacterium]
MTPFIFISLPFVLFFLLSQGVGARAEKNRRKRDDQISIVLDKAGERLALSDIETRRLQDQIIVLRKSSQKELDGLKDVVDDL